MVDYNPSLPVILGQEWVPIRDESLVFSPTVNAFEIGTTFTLASSKVLSSASCYVHELSPARSAQVIWVSVYQNGTENQSGPIESVIIPVNAGGVTGAGVTAGGGSVQAALYSPADAVDIVFQTPNGNLYEADMYFATNQYAQLLQGKRILGISFLYAGYGYSQDTVTNDFIPLDLSELSDITLSVRQGATNTILGSYGPLTGFVIDQGLAGDTTHPVVEVPLGETFILKSPRPLPLTYADLALFEATAGVSRCNLQVELTMDASGNPNNVLRLAYGAMKVYYCDETRLAVAAIGGAVVPIMNNGVNSSTMYSAVAQTTNPVLAAGDYIATLSAPSLGDLGSAYLSLQTTYPKLNALRQQFAISSLEARQVNIPNPLDSNIGEQFTVEEVNVLPQISLATSGGILTEVHPYGRQVAAEVWGNVYAEQELLDTPVGVATDFPWVRFIARRFGDTTIPLTLTGQGGLAGSTTSITPDDFDELDEILDGWKEVTLDFNTPPSMGTVGTPTWRFTATGETAGNRWEVLGATAPALSGIPGNLLNLAPASQQLYTATYSAPTGDIQELVWVPQGISSPPVSGSGTQDDAADLFLIFAQMPPDVSGFGVVTLCQPVTGIGQDCEVDPCCVPSSIYFNQLTWDAVSPSGFGYYEIQRSDTVDSDWLTIMEGTDPTGITYNDFEARVGIDTSYRIRAIDLYGFTGEWSDTISALIPEPGVVIGCDDGHLLIFTSNERQSGAINLAYSSVWYEQQVSEEFTFVESSFVQLQAMYDRDYFVAFRPLERGGEQFSRTVLVQAAAISPPTLGDFRSLRDMAWDSVNYVCVRDEEGNRWFATVGVPSGRVLNNRRLYLAPVQVVEVTTTPTPVDPADEAVAGEVVGNVCDDFECEDVVAEDSFDRVEVDEWGESD